MHERAPPPPPPNERSSAVGAFTEARRVCDSRTPPMPPVLNGVFTFAPQNGVAWLVQSTWPSQPTKFC
jgi:hypothetical protein